MIPKKAVFPKHIAPMATTDSGKKGKLFLIVGPSGVGKGTLMRMLKERHPEFAYPKSSVTTRPMRSDDLEGEPYSFVSDAAFDELARDGQLLEQCEFAGYRYGMVRDPIISALEMGMPVLRESEIYDWYLLEERHPELQGRLRSVFLLPPSMDVLVRRIRARSPLSEEQIRLRMESAALEVQVAHLADLQVVTEEGGQEKVYETVERYILSELQT